MPDDDDVSDSPSDIRPVPGIKPPQQFSLGSNALDNWNIFRQRWKSYIVLS